MNVETVWYYTGAAFWIALGWFAVAVLVWAGAQLAWSAWKKYGRYKRIMQLLDFLDEDRECSRRFEEWLDGLDSEEAQVISMWRKLRRLMGGRSG